MIGELFLRIEEINHQPLDRIVTNEAQVKVVTHVTFEEIIQTL